MAEYLADEDGHPVVDPSGRIMLAPSETAGVVERLRINPPRVISGFVYFSVPTPPTADTRGYWLEFYGTVAGRDRAHKVYVPLGASEILGPAADILGPFQGNSPFEGYNVAVDLPAGLAPVRKKLTTPARPGVVSFSVDTGDEPGEVVFTIGGPLPSGGDGPNVGDGLGVAAYVDVTTDGGATFESLGNGALTTGPVSWFGDPGTPYAFQLRSRSAYRAGALSAVRTATTKEAADPVGVTPTDLGTWQDLSLVDGDDLSIDFDTFIANADSYEIVEGISGASYNATTHVYSLSGIAAGEYSIVFRATNGSNSILLNWTVSVVVEVIAPALRVPIPNQSLNVGGTLNLNLLNFFDGTDLAFSVTPNDNATFGLGTGGEASRFKAKVALNTAFATTSFTITASNSAGNATATFTVTVAAAARAAAPTWGTSVNLVRAETMFSGYRAAVVSFPTGIDVIPGSTIRRLWTTGIPDANDDIPPDQWEELEDIGAGEWRTRMSDPARRQSPDVEAAEVALGANPITTGSGSNVVSIKLVGHGFSVPRNVRIGGASAVGGLTLSGLYPIASVVDADSFTIIAPANASSGATGGGASVTLRANRANYGVWGQAEATRAERLRVAIEVNGVIGHVSEPTTVPPVAVPILARRWHQNSKRIKAAFDAVPPWGGAEGKQFLHAVCQNKGASRDPKKKYWLYGGQDENGLSFSPDGGATIGPTVSLGLWASSITAIYYNSDDLANGLLLVGGGHGFLTGRCGLYYSVDEAKTFRRINLKLPNGDDVWKVNNTYFPRVNLNLIDRRPQNAAGTLTDAQRPIYYVAQTKGTVGSSGAGNFTGCHVFRWMGGDIGDPANWDLIYSFTPSDIQGESSTIDGPQGMTWVAVAPNGDLLIGGRKGLWLSTNAATGSVTFTKISSASIRGLAVDLTKGTSEVSGAVIGISDQGSGVACVQKTNNVRSTAFSAPANSGIPSGVACTSLNGAPYNFNKIWLVYNGNGSGNGAGCLLTTNGGASWSEVLCQRPSMLPSSEKWRYDFAGNRVPAVYPNPTDPNIVFALTQQSAAISKNGGTSFSGFDSVYFDHAHSKGWHWDKRDLKRHVTMQQDGGAHLSPDAPNYGEYLGLTFDVQGTKTGGAAGQIRALVMEATGASAGQTRTGGKGACILHDSDMMVFAESVDTEHNRCVPVILSPTAVNSPYGSRRVRTELGWSRCAHTLHHPTVDECIIMGKWFIFGWTDTMALAANPFSVSAGGNTITVKTPTAHGLTVGRVPRIAGATLVAGLDPNGGQVVRSVPSSTTFTIQVSGSASANVSAGGGSSVTLKRPKALDSISFATRSDREILGYSMPASSPIWYFGGAGTTGRAITRSTDPMGLNPVAWGTASNDFENQAAAADPFVDECVYYVPGSNVLSARTVLRRIKRVSSLVDTVIFDAQAAVAAIYADLGLPTTNIPFAVIEQVVPDRVKPGRVYALINAPGLPVVFQIDGASGDTQTITNITGNMPHTNLWHLAHLAPTGELTANSSMGEWWFPAAADFVGADKSYITSTLHAFYERADVPDPVGLPVAV